jgi:hypothetical protein
VRELVCRGRAVLRAKGESLGGFRYVDFRTGG